MTDDLVKRLREYGDWPQDVLYREWAECSHKAADRIEQLEAANLKASLITVDHLLRIETLEAELHSCFHRIEELQAALRELACKCVSNCDWEKGDICPSWTARKALEGKDDAYD